MCQLHSDTRHTRHQARRVCAAAPTRATCRMRVWRTREIDAGHASIRRVARDAGLALGHVRHETIRRVARVEKFPKKGEKRKKALRDARQRAPHVEARVKAPHL